MGRIAAPFGVKGWVKIQPFTETPGSLSNYREWWLGRHDSWDTCVIEGAQEQGQYLVAKLAGCDDRDAAALMNGTMVGVDRSELPPPAAGEYYWTDLVGLEVRNTDGVVLGRVGHMMETGANDVLVVEGDRERLIPFVGEVIRSVDISAGVLTVEWGVDY